MIVVPDIQEHPPGNMMTRAMYETLPLSELKQIAKVRKMKGVSTLKKADLIDRMLEEDKKEEEAKALQAEQAKPDGTSGDESASETIQKARKRPAKKATAGDAASADGNTTKVEETVHENTEMKSD